MRTLRRRRGTSKAYFAKLPCHIKNPEKIPRGISPQPQWHQKTGALKSDQLLQNFQILRTQIQLITPYYRYIQSNILRSTSHRTIFRANPRQKPEWPLPPATPPHWQRDECEIVWKTLVKCKCGREALTLPA
ncbi:hypothetical protein J6590_054328 [Homalodisca vitripennis]|nr:hypothetical protein J6590_054328 [Homalodisca vitripennis]